jgi:cell division protein ZapA (FtsZ GTPase activity inhibitor)
LTTDPKAAVRVKILDIEYSVTGYDDPEYLLLVAAVVDRHMRALSQKYNEASHLRNAILTALNLADELLHARKQLEEHQVEASDFNRQVTDRSRRLIELCNLVQS